MAKFDLDSYETVGERINKAHELYPDLRITTHLVDIARDDFNKPIQYIVMAQIWIGDVLKGQDYAEEIVGSSNVNRTSALENCTTSAIGRALASGLNLQGVDPRKTRPSREEMEKVERMTTKSYTPEQEQMAAEAAGQLRDIESIDELRNLYEGAKNAGILHIEPMGSPVSLNTLIGARKKELSGGN